MPQIMMNCLQSVTGHILFTADRAHAIDAFNYTGNIIKRGKEKKIICFNNMFSYVKIVDVL